VTLGGEILWRGLKKFNEISATRVRDVTTTTVAITGTHTGPTAASRDGKSGRLFHIREVCFATEGDTAANQHKKSAFETN